MKGFASVIKKHFFNCMFCKTFFKNLKNVLNNNIIFNETTKNRLKKRKQNTLIGLNRTYLFFFLKYHTKII